MFLWVVFVFFLKISTLSLPIICGPGKKSIVFPVNVEDKLVWGHLTFSCLLVLVCGVIGLISNFRSVRKTVVSLSLSSSCKANLPGVGSRTKGLPACPLI